MALFITGKGIILHILHKPVCICILLPVIRCSGVEVGVTPVILSGNNLKLLFAFILTFEIGLENWYDSAKIGNGWHLCKPSLTLYHMVQTCFIN